MTPGRSTASPSGPAALWAALFFLGLTVVCTWPMVRDARDHVQDLGDPLLEVTALTWAAQALGTPAAGLFDAPQFYPYRDVAVYQNSFFGQLPLFAPLLWATGNPVLAFQVTVLLALFLSGWCMWAYVRHLTGDSLAGLLAGATFAFHQYRFRNLQHLQVMSIWWWPLALWALEDFLTTRRWRSVLALGAAGVAQLYCSVYMGLLLVLAVAVRLLVEVLAEPPRLADRMLWRRGFLTLVYGSALVAPLILAYVRVGRQFPPAHDVAAIAQFSAAPRDYLRLGLSSVPYYWLRARAAWQFTFDQHVLFPGVVASVLALYGFARAEMVARLAGPVGRYARRHAFALVLTATVGVILSLGPYLKQDGLATDLPLPALALLTHVPGFGIFRVNTRFAFLLLLTLSVGVGLAFHAHVLRRQLTGRRRAGVCCGVLAVLLLENWNAPVPSVPVAVGADVPPVYAVLATEDPDRGPVVEVPFGRTLYEDIRRVYYGLGHGRRLLNGYSTVEPPGYRQFAALAAPGPTPDLLAALAAWDVRTMVVHYADMAPREADRWRAGRALPDVQVWREFDGGDIWKLGGAPALVDHPQATLTVRTIPAGETAEATMRLTTPPATVWRCPRPLGLRTATVTWQPVDTAAVVEDGVRILVPLFVVSTHPVNVTVPLRAPMQPGRYTLRVDCGVAAAHTRLQVVVPPRTTPSEPGN